MAGGGGSGSPIILSPSFKFIFKSVVTLTVLPLLVSIGLGIYISWQPKEAPNLEQVKGLVDACSTVFKLGCGAIFGLIGGKAT